MALTKSSIDRVILHKAPGLLAARLRELILRGEFMSGDLLPPERDLVTESGLSRGSVREALKILETEGLVEIRSGRLGGARVTIPKRTALARSTELFVRANGVNLESLLDCRIAVEPMLARLAARHRSEAELKEICQLHAEFETSVDDIQRYRQINFHWHLAIAAASRNEPLTALMEAIATPVFEATGYEVVTTPDTRRGAVKAHAAVVAAIERQDEEAAARAMEKHLTSYSSILRATPPKP
jgi:GntR family transcriptional regulator, transcriptional repressor for pyruvate dehydrogenase complex